MISIDPALLIIAAEAGAGIIILLLILSIKIVLKRRHDNAALRHLVEAIKGSTDNRKEAIEDFLKNSCNYDAENVTKFTAELLQSETALYRQVIDAAFTRKKEALAQIVDKTEQLVANYRALTVARTQGAVETNTITVVDEQRITELSQETERLTSEIADLKEHNEKLNKDLANNESEMDRIIAEYSNVFHNKPSEVEAEVVKPPVTETPATAAVIVPASPTIDIGNVSQPSKLTPPLDTAQVIDNNEVALILAATAQSNNAGLIQPTDGQRSTNPLIEEKIQNLDVLDELLNLTNNKDKK